MIYCFILNIAVFCLYGYDKYQAQHRGWRIPEKVLLLLGFFGGGAGGLLGMKVWHHKTKHRYFYFINALGVLWQLACLIYLM